MAFYGRPASPERVPGACTTPTVIPKTASVGTCALYSHVPAIDKASQAPAKGLPTGVPTSFRAFADHSGVPCSTLYHRARGRQSIQAKAQSQQYLAPFEEKAVVQFILQMAELGTPVRIKYIPSIAFTATRHRPEADRPASLRTRTGPKLSRTVIQN
jgi:hypothetical protein